MSFILDALKKIEQDKRRADGGRSESIAISRSGFGERRHLFSMVAIAIGSALLTAAAVSWLNRPEPSLAPTEPVAETAAAMTAPPSTPEPPREGPTEASAAMGAVAVRKTEEPDAAPRPPARTVASDVAPEREAVATVPAVDTPASEERDPEASETSEIPPDIDDAPEETAPPESQPIRLVGRERALLNGLNIEPSSDDAASEIESEDVEPLPEDFPRLVLQGTSIIGAKAVAVISDQRVFEGDRVEGALVVRIGEREVELELDGRRFKLGL